MASFWSNSSGLAGSLPSEATRRNPKRRAERENRDSQVRNPHSIRTDAECVDFWGRLNSRRKGRAKMLSTRAVNSGGTDQTGKPYETTGTSKEFTKALTQRKPGGRPGMMRLQITAETRLA